MVKLSISGIYVIKYEHTNSSKLYLSVSAVATVGPP
jgi:hypothetical protein